MKTPRPKVVIVGAGFAGLSAAKQLRKAPVDVTIIDQQNHHLFQPLLYQVATAALAPADIAMPIRRILRHQENANVIMDRLVSVDKGSKSLTLASGNTVPYDQLILATGAQHSYFGQDDWADVAPGLKTLDDALNLRDKVLSAFEQAERVGSQNTKEADALLTFVVVGAGPTGVELAGAISELSSSMQRDFRKIKDAPVSVILIEGTDRVLPTFDPKLSQKAKINLEQLGVEVRLNTMVTDVSASMVQTNQANIATKTIIWAAGVHASPVATWLGLESGPNGRLAVDASLRPAGEDDIYVIGDVARFEQDGSPIPGVAPAAKQMGIYVGKRISRLAKGKTVKRAFKYSNSGSLATIGRNRAVADIYGLKITGFAGWFLWGAAHVYFLIGFKNRMFVTLQWIWSYITWQRGARLITDHQITQPEHAKTSNRK